MQQNQSTQQNDFIFIFIFIFFWGAGLIYLVIREEIEPGSSHLLGVI